jgi:uncharacterized protein YqjF (DUF2071 family)
MRQARTFLSAEWRWLAMLNYAVEPGLLASHVPPGTELDAWGGRTYVSIVGFRFLRTRVLGCAVPRHRDFEEVNLRFYVRRRGAEGWRRGVVFIKEIVPRTAIATVARVCYGEPYVALPMRHGIDIDAASGTLRPGGAVEYGWRFGGRWYRLRAVTDGAPEPLQEGSEEEFITEHYWGYTARRGGCCTEYRVEHPPWRVWRVCEATLECDVAALYGAQFAEPLRGAPHSAFVAEGSPILVRMGHRLPAESPADAVATKGA